ncbi:MAG: hypothetical protein A2X56_04450 [Nitrospirae bacterium GWC2_57_13]|nr:MAG: hypothetical protein A2X56_04450 [Nitrospirae bacterium GWC2_57_13]OGW43633.1 MAG: hypothetical protein A2X57_12785 [Nitrospirae bacterium GWD2_57_8]
MRGEGTVSRVNCWEFKQCGRQPGGEKVEELGVCPVTEARKLHGVHGGVNAGRACWIVAGTMCGGKVAGTFAQELGNCWKCDFYSSVRSRENDATLGFSGSRLGMERSIDKLVQVDHLAQITGIGKVHNLEALRGELTRTARYILGGKPDIFLKDLENLSARKSSTVSLVRHISRKIHLLLDDRKAGVLEEAMLRVVDKYL